jgi:hypothetical protein
MDPALSPYSSFNHSSFKTKWTVGDKHMDVALVLYDRLYGYNVQSI